jgi:hypothetical protein
MNNEILVVVFTALFLYWLYKCCAVVREGWYENVKTFGGGYVRTLSAVRGIKVDNTGKKIKSNESDMINIIIFGKKIRGFFWIWYGLEFIDSYWFSWAQAMNTIRVPKDEAENVIWGKMDKDAEVTYQRYEKTRGHKDQDDYHFRVNNVETGEKNEKKPDEDSAENVKLNFLLNATVVMENLYDVQYRDGGKVGWYSSLEATIEGTLGEIVRATTYSDIKDIMGDKIPNVEVSNVEPTEERGATGDDPGYKFMFKDEQGKRKDKITFLERINYEMLYKKRLGVKVINITLMDVAVSDDSKKYVDALEKKAISIVNLATADNDANAENKFFQKRKKVVVDILTANKNAVIDMKKVPDQTIVQKAEHQAGVRVLMETQSEGANKGGVDMTRIIENLLSFDLHKEITDTVKDDSTKPDRDKNRPQNKKGGKH